MIGLINILNEALDNPYEIGKNDCNLIVLKWIDLFCGTDYMSTANLGYDNVKDGLKLFQSIGFAGIEELIKQHADVVEVTAPILGDIWVASTGLNVTVFQHNAHIAVLEDHTGFYMNKEAITEDGKFYRLRKVTKWERVDSVAF